MSTGRYFQMSQSEGLGVQGIQPYFFTLYGHLSLTDASSSFRQVNMCHHSSEARGLLRVHHFVITQQSSLHSAFESDYSRWIELCELSDFFLRSGW